jgi:hypothetical protein
MNTNSGSETNATTLLALRTQDDAVRVISEHLKVREMGPADHIRTKHEVKAFVASGDINEAEALAQRASERRAVNQSVTMKITMTQKRGQRMSL